ncbi:hypothetical protein NQZ68_015979 [Dissostichus eleginoides]|nr:hypothetical protein NQZ68_015979 [Dissostichus eleginoides]
MEKPGAAKLEREEFQYGRFSGAAVAFWSCRQEVRTEDAGWCVALPGVLDLHLLRVLSQVHGPRLVSIRVGTGQRVKELGQGARWSRGGTPAPSPQEPATPQER